MPDIYNLIAMTSIIATFAAIVVYVVLTIWKPKIFMPLLGFLFIYACTAPIADALRERSQRSAPSNPTQQPEGEG